MPIYYATGSKLRAFGWSLLSGVTEPIGGIVGFAILQPVFTETVYGIVFAMVGGSNARHTHRARRRPTCRDHRTSSHSAAAHASAHAPRAGGDDVRAQ
jgi:hypothetical protein